MKRILGFLGLAILAGAGLFSCNKAEINSIDDSHGLYTYTFTLSDDATRATIGVEDGKKVINWETGDRLGVYAVGADNISYNRYADIDLEKTPNEFKISSYMALVEGDMIYAYAPYVKFSSDNGEDWKSPTTVPLSIPAAQSQKGTTFDADAMPKVSIPYSMPDALAAQTDMPVGDIKMVNLGAIIDFKIYSSNSKYVKEKVQSVSFEATTALVGDFVFDLTGVKYSDASTMAIKDYTEKTVKTTVTTPGTLGSEKASAYDVYMVIAPGTYSGNVIVETNEATYTYPVNGKTFNRNVIHNIGVNLRDDVREQVVNYVTLDWTFPEEEGSSAILDDLNKVVGVKTYSLGTYAAGNAPYQIQFNADNDYIQVKTDVAIGAVSLDYKMIGGGNTSYFDIYESTDGAEWGEAIQRLTIAGSQNSTGTVTTTVAFSSSSRYVKINFVKGSNVGVGKISITKPNTDPIIIASDIANVPAVGVTSARASYETRNFTNDVKVASFDGCVTAATITESQVIYSVGPNYESTAKTGTITLQSESTPTITKTINVEQLKSILTVTPTEVLIPASANEATFTITSVDFGWTITADDDSHIAFDDSGAASENPFTVTVYSDVEASDSEQTIATLTIIRNGNNNDPQKKTVVVKKAVISSTTEKYVKVSSIEEGVYLMVYDGKAASSTGTSLGISPVTIVGDEIASDTTVDTYAIEIASVGNGQYTLKMGDKYIGYGNASTKTNLAAASTASTNYYKWTITFDEAGDALIVNVGTNTRYIGANGTGSSFTSFKAYATQNVSQYPCPSLYKYTGE